MKRHKKEDINHVVELFIDLLTNDIVLDPHMNASLFEDWVIENTYNDGQEVLVEELHEAFNGIVFLLQAKLEEEA